MWVNPREWPAGSSIDSDRDRDVTRLPVCLIMALHIEMTVEVSERSYDLGVSESVWSMFLCGFVAIVLIPFRIVLAIDGEFQATFLCGV